jgi:hypothetical protein
MAAPQGVERVTTFFTIDTYDVAIPAHDDRFCGGWEIWHGSERCTVPARVGSTSRASHTARVLARNVTIESPDSVSPSTP